MSETETITNFDRARTVRPLIPWATSGWTGYNRGVRDYLDDARHAIKVGDASGADYWITKAVEYAARKCEMHRDLHGEKGTYADAWERQLHSPVFAPFAWPVPRHADIREAIANRTFDVITERGVPMRVALYLDGECEHYPAASADEALVEFFDLRYAHTPDGQHISRYYLSTLNERWGGINLYGGVPDWTINDETMAPVRLWLRRIAGA